MVRTSHKYLKQQTMHPLIDKYLDGTLSEAESGQLRKWLRDPQHQRQVKSYLHTQADLYTELQEADWETGYEGFIAWALGQSLGQVPEVKPPVKRLPVWSPYVAAAMVVVLLGLGIYWVQRDTDAMDTPEVTIHDIQTGTDRATLTLEDGAKVPLEKGTVYQNTHATSDGEKIVYQSPTTDREAPTYNILTIPRGGQFQLALSDGTRVWLNSESRLRYPVAFAPGETREVELLYGEAYFAVSPSSTHEGPRFRVRHTAQEVEVLGTEFNVKAYGDERHVYTTLVEGKVAVYANGHDHTLQPGEQSNFDEKSRTLEVARVDIYNETSWKDGVFSFEGKPLKEIMKVLSRWYDMEVVFSNRDLEEVKFVGVLGKDQDIADILATLQQLGSIGSYEIDGKTVVLR